MGVDLTAAPLADLTVEFGTRPAAPKLDTVTPQQHAAGQHLAMIHSHYLQDLARIAMVIDRIEAGDTPPAHLAQIVLASEMSQNFAAFGTLCGQGCRMLMMHHDIEEAHMFPAVDAKAPASFAPIVARLREEHHVIHELLNRLGEAAQTLATRPDPAGFATTRDIYHALLAAIESHFGYEEASLEEAIGVYLDGI